VADASEIPTGSGKIRYEYRVWGEHRSARKKLVKLADEETRQYIEDCYLIGDDPDWNAKVRNNEMKVKQLVGEERGFERWITEWFESSDDAPRPFDDLFDELRLDRPQRGKSYNLLKEVAKLDPDTGARAVFVTKRRRRYRIGRIRAEVTDVEINGSDDVMRTLSIEGDDLDELVALRKRLGLADEPNLAMHVAIEAEI
jgi:hypothetical protein